MSTPEMLALAEFTAERKRQIEQEGWDIKHDDAHDGGELMSAAMCYLNEARDMNSHRPDGKPLGWPWDDMWWKPTTPGRNTIKAGALFLAETERLQRAGKPHHHVDQKLQLAAKHLSALRSASAGGRPDIASSVWEALKERCAATKNKSQVKALVTVTEDDVKHAILSLHPVGPDTFSVGAFETLRGEVCAAIAFLARDSHTDRLQGTVDGLIKRLAEADKAARAALPLPGEKDVQTKIAALKVTLLSMQAALVDFVMSSPTDRVIVVKPMLVEAIRLAECVEQKLQQCQVTK